MNCISVISSRMFCVLYLCNTYVIVIAQHLCNIVIARLFSKEIKVTSLSCTECELSGNSSRCIKCHIF